MRLLADKGLSLDDIIEIAESMSVTDSVTRDAAPKSPGALRQARLRQRRKDQGVTRDANSNATGDVSPVTVDVVAPPLPPPPLLPPQTPPITPPPPAPPGIFPCVREALPVEQAFLDWQKAAKHSGWAIPTKLTDQRRKKLEARLREHGLEGWRSALTRACESRMLGHDPPSWFDFDFLTRNAENILKLIEGKYDEPFGKTQSFGSGPSAGSTKYGDGFRNPVLARIAGKAST